MKVFTALAFFLVLADVYAKPYVTDACDGDAFLHTQILPGCSYKTALTKLFQCAQPFFSGFPYYSIPLCKSNMNMAVMCFGVLANECIGGTCKTIFDNIDEVTQVVQQFQAMQKQGTFAKFSKPSDIFQFVTEGQGMMTSEEFDSIAYQACHTPSEYQALLAQSGGQITETNYNIGEPVCDNRILDDLQAWGVAYLDQFAAATTNKMLCGKSLALKDKIIKAWNTRCSSKEVRKLVDTFLVSSYLPSLLSVNLTQVIGTTYDAIDNQFPLPGCPDTSLAHHAKKGRF